MFSAHSELRSSTSGLRRLDELDMPLILGHLYAMDEDDRHLRFGNNFSNDKLHEYAKGINFNRDVVIGAFSEGELIGVCHLAVFPEKGHPVGEIGISVDKTKRGHRFGARLMDAAFVEAAIRRVTYVYIYFLRRNRRMAGMCARLGAEIEHDGDECTARIALHPQGSDTHIESLFVGSRRLEVFAAGPLEGKTVVLVHGAGGDAWQWRQNFMPYLANKGARCVSVSLRSHGKSPRELAKSLDDYLEDVGEVMSASDSLPILVGHSMGGLVVQRYLERHAAEKAVLLGAVPPNGLQGDALKAAQQGLRSEFARDILGRAMVDFEPIDVSRISTPVTVIGGAKDKVVPPELVFDTARAYGTLAHVIPDAGHALMLGRYWRMAASLI
jgi:non-heme chloroperoxidase